MMCNPQYGVENLIRYLMPVRKRFGNTAVSYGTISWGSRALERTDET